MDYKEEQQQEIEVLESIYPDELSIISDTRYRILINIDRAVQPKTIELEVEYPETYPEVEPELKLQYYEGNEDDDDENEEDNDQDYNANYANDDDLHYFGETELSRLQREIKQCAQENVGMPSVFTIVSTIKDRAEEMYDELVKQLEKERLKRQQEEEEAELRKHQGTPVTLETFSKWIETYRHNIGRDRAQRELQERTKNANLPPSGREIFEQGLNHEADDEEGANEA